MLVIDPTAETGLPTFNCPYVNFSVVHGLHLVQEVDSNIREEIKKLKNESTIIVDASRDGWSAEYVQSCTAMFCDITGFKGNFVYLINEFDSGVENAIYFPLWMHTINDYSKRHKLPAVPEKRRYNMSALIRNPQPHKLMLYHSMAREGLLDREDVLVSYAGLSDAYNAYSCEPLLNTDWFLAHVPKHVANWLRDTPIRKIDDCPSGLGNQGDHTINSPAFMSTYMHIAVESGFATNFISEKTCKPILAGQPFMVAGGPNTMRALRSLGFDTFNHVFGTEGYDSIIDMHKRMAAIAKNARENSDHAEEICFENAREIEHNRLWLASNELTQKLYKPLIERNLI